MSAVSKSESKHCPKCGSLIPAEAPQGLCPKCLLAEVSIPTETGKAAPEKSAPPAHDELVAAFPQLEILELIGEGGMGYVFKARQPKLDRFVALKILPQSLAADPAFAERFSREGRLLARLNHPNIVSIHDFGQANGFFYLVMEFVDGVNLRQAMKAGRFTPEQALAVVPKICEGLQYAHNEGILHRDIKPENILLDTKGRVKIADFGIAKLVDESWAEAAATVSGAPPIEAKLTAGGATLGTPNYMAPEQFKTPSAVDHRADIYSLGVVFYEMLTGELPVSGFAPPSQKCASDPRLDRVVLRALEKEPVRRTQSANEVKTGIETIVGSFSTISAPAEDRPRGRFHKTVAVIVVAALLVGLVRLFLIQPMVAQTDAAAPEIPRQSHFLVWKLASNFKSGDLIAYRDGGRKLLGRIIGADAETVVVHRNNDTPEIVARKNILGRIIGNTRASAPQMVVGSLRLIGATGYKNIAIARAESLAGYPLHQIIVHFAGPELSEEQLALARGSLTGPLLVPSQQERIPGGDYLSLATNSVSWGSFISYECPGPCQLQFALPDEKAAREAAGQMEKALGYSSRLVPGERLQLFATGSWEAWLETRRFQPLVDKFAFFRHSGWSPAQIPGTNRVESVVATIPAGHELIVTGRYVSNGVFQSEETFSTTLSSPANEPGLYWFTWYCLPNPQTVDERPKESWELCIHDAITSRELHRFRPSQAVGTAWRRQGYFDGPTSLLSGEPLKRVIFAGAGGVAGKPPPPFILMEMIMRPGKAEIRSRNGSEWDASHADSPTVTALADKIIVLTGVTNRLTEGSNGVRIVSVHTDSTIFPGETLISRTKQPDGRLADGSTTFITTRYPNSFQTYSGFSWFFPNSFTARDAEDAVTQIQRNKAERPIALTSGETLELFSVTNKFGGRLSGNIEFKRVRPQPPSGSEAKIHATIHVRVAAAYLPSLNYVANVPMGYALRASSNIGQASTSVSFSSRGAEYHSAWFFPPEWTLTRALPETLNTRRSLLEAQFHRLEEEGPLQVVLGEPRSLFSVTNSGGEVFNGFFELVAPPPATDK